MKTRFFQMIQGAFGNHFGRKQQAISFSSASGHHAHGLSNGHGLHGIG